MRRPASPDHHQRLLPAGHRWGFGAHSVLPYLQLAQQAWAGDASDGSILNPVFPQMEQTLRAPRRKH